jgi:hypothetical protein
LRRWGLCAHEGEKVARTPTIHTAVGSVLLIVHMGQCQLLGAWLCLARVRASRAYVRACAHARCANCEGREALGPDAPNARARGFRAGTRRGAPRTETISSSWGRPGVDRMLARHTLAHSLAITTHLHGAPAPSAGAAQADKRKGVGCIGKWARQRPVRRRRRAGVHPRGTLLTCRLRAP